MIYQRRMPKKELFSAQVELLLQSSKSLTFITHFLGVLVAVCLLWHYVELPYLLSWAGTFISALFLRSVHVRFLLKSQRIQKTSVSQYWQLLFWAAVKGGVWAGVYIYLAGQVPIGLQYSLLLIIVMVSVLTVCVTMMVREYFIIYIFCSLWPIAWWSMVHYEERPINVVIGIILLGVCVLLSSIANRTYQIFHNMIAFNWERETMSKELGDMARSLRDRNRQLNDARQQLTDLANIDELTGLGNRRLVNRVLRDEINRARRQSTPLSVILLDVDYFKKYNDTYGHLAGDAVLQKLADLMHKATSRAGEVAARYGGEEFILILPNANIRAAQQTADRLAELIEQANIPHSASEIAPYVTVSQGGVSLLPDTVMDPFDLVAVADDMLYKAKAAGRNTAKLSLVESLNQPPVKAVN